MSLLNHVPSSITNEMNNVLNLIHVEEEVKSVVFQLNGESVSVLDGFVGQFHKSCWEIIGSDFVKVVASFFS